MIEGLIDPDTPAALIAAHRVVVSNAQARQLGVRRGMLASRVRTLEVTTQPYDPQRDAAVFMTIVESFGEVVADAEVLRPGMLAVNYNAAQNFHGQQVGEALANAAAFPGLDYSFGIAPDLTTAILAARGNTVVTNPAEFLANLPTRILRDEPALACDVEVVASFEDLGLHTLASIADIPSRAMLARFGQAGRRCQLIAQGQLQHMFSPVAYEQALQVHTNFEEPATRLEDIVFVAKRLALELQEMLIARNLVCTRIKIQANSGAEIYTKTWTSQSALSQDDIAQRIRWQFAQWQQPLDALTLIPECSVAQKELWAGSREKAAESIARIQSQLGVDAVQQPIHIGGRGVAERVGFIPYGQNYEQIAPWKGAIPKPLPARVFHPAAQVHLLDGHQNPVTVNGDSLSAVPKYLSWGSRDYLIEHWAGPWLVDDAWWQGGQLCARIQVQCETSAFLLLWAGKWRMEASYE